MFDGCAYISTAFLRSSSVVFERHPQLRSVAASSARRVKLLENISVSFCEEYCEEILHHSNPNSRLVNSFQNVRASQPAGLQRRPEFLWISFPARPPRPKSGSRTRKACGRSVWLRALSSENSRRQLLRAGGPLLIKHYVLSKRTSRSASIVWTRRGTCIICSCGHHTAPALHDHHRLCTPQPTAGRSPAEKQPV